MAKAQPQKDLPASARTVVVACKIPNGLILQLQHAVERMEDGPLGPKPRTYSAFHGRRYHVIGPAYPVGTTPKGYPKPPLIEGGYALTRGIPADFWEQWVSQNSKAPYVVAPDGAERGMIFAFADMESTVDAAREQEKLLSGLEPISTDEDSKGKLTDPRLPRPLNGSVDKLAFEPHPNNG